MSMEKFLRDIEARLASEEWVSIEARGENIIIPLHGMLWWEGGIAPGRADIRPERYRMKIQLALRSLAMAREPVRLSLEGGTVSYDGVIERVGADFLELRLLNGGQYPRIYERDQYVRAAYGAQGTYGQVGYSQGSYGQSGYGQGASGYSRAPRGAGVRTIPLARVSAVIARISR